MPLVYETPTDERNVVHLRPVSHLDIDGGNLLQQEIAAINHIGDRLWLIDMTDVEFMDSAGLFALVSTLNLAHLSDCRLILRHLRPSIKLVFEITQLDRVFEIVDSSRSADVDLLASVPIAA